jgi:ribosomal protein S18 acetylase RimI-like enzyme
VTDPSVELRPTIDRAWLEQEGARHPLVHAFALWDLERTPDRVRFFMAVVKGAPVGYLLVWLGHPTATIVHWVGTDPATRGLASLLPPRPLVAIVPGEMREVALAVRGPAREHGLVQMARTAALTSRAPEPSSGVRLLAREDVPRLTAWARRQVDPVVAEYPYLDPEVDRIWGAFDGTELVGAVRAEVRLPRVWVLGGVYVDASARGRGVGRALVTAAVRAGEATGARVTLYVREDRVEVRHLYESLGFRTVDQRVWLDFGAGLSP